MLRGLRSRLRAVREDLKRDQSTLVTSRLWNAEQQVANAESMISGTDSHSEAPERK